MNISVKPQDKRPLETAEFQMHPDILARLRAYAASLDDSDVHYVLGEVLNQALPALGKAQKNSAVKANVRGAKRVKEAA